ncbi:hypothetical protein LFT45_22430 (plasmid) [Arthrobacter sp. FW305-BF8]|uniref:hypothetical protein n=1 Tax=Arthrobacter sp. FW305-BF8 TaxID=2879617 RepID=UPI001F1FA2C9|nr:hypothetical protein [Arthrobacter sp. FW305-BF8]UKA56639.1 hypothetical protein LFT45_22430 [Arthrobacter sp. FW305-BF8]
MNPTSPAASAPRLSRRQFVLILGGGALLLAGGGAYGVISRSLPGEGSGLATAFGTLSLLNTGRLARLDAQGKPAAKPMGSAISQVTNAPDRATGSDTSRG